VEALGGGSLFNIGVLYRRSLVMNGGPYGLGPSLVLARMSSATQLPREQQLLARLQTAASNVGCRSQTFVTATYIALKLHWRVIVYGLTRDRTLSCWDALTATLVGSGSQQTLHIHGPIGSDSMTQRFAAVRLGEFTASAVDQSGQNKAWFVLVDTPGDPTPTLQWVEREIGATLQANGRPAQLLPSNMFVLVAAGERPVHAQRCWLSMAAPEWSEAAGHTDVLTTPLVGYQRQLLDSQLTSALYRQRLREGQVWRGAIAVARARGLSWSQVARWLAASVDERQQGLWTANDPVANARHAISVLEALQHTAANVA
jgi:hypothetical protein